MTKLLLIAAGGGAGSMLRYALAGLTQRVFGGQFPAGTLAVNVLGCFAIGFLATMFTGLGNVREEWRLILVVGLLGGFTTFSALGYETVSLFQSGRVGAAVLTVLANNVLGLGAAWLGYALAQARLV